MYYLDWLYMRLRAEKRHLLAQDGVHLQLEVERALLVNSIKKDLQASLLRDPGWTQMGLNFSAYHWCYIRVNFVTGHCKEVAHIWLGPIP